ncbi:MAG: hypothetical protein HC919_06565 [Oscillatoriales cyanobacterium SM2_2_1]|nr:hypothetical protein [Oscillatoriales cyanobacterium SM2_2_1]
MTTPFRVPAYYALIIRSLVTLEGIALGVDRNFKVLSVAYPYVANRLLTDQSPELRHALKDMLFRDGSFRWQRLENLLSNAQSNQVYDLEHTLDRTLDFLLSSRGDYMREQLVEELVRGIEQEAARRLGGTTDHQPTSLDALSRILRSLQQQRTLTPLEILRLLQRFVLKPEAQGLIRQAIRQLTQRTVVRLVREFVLQEEQRSALQPQSVGVLHRQVKGRTW